MLTDADWDPVFLDQKRVQQMIDASPASGTLATDDTTFPKQGRHSVGVTHQVAQGGICNPQKLPSKVKDAFCYVDADRAVDWKQEATQWVGRGEIPNTSARSKSS